MLATRSDLDNLRASLTKSMAKWYIAAVEGGPFGMYCINDGDVVNYMTDAALAVLTAQLSMHDQLEDNGYIKR